MPKTEPKVALTEPPQWSEQFGAGEIFAACELSALPVNPIVCVANVGQTCYLSNSCGQKSAAGVIGCDGTCGNRYETTKLTPSGHYLGTYDDFRKGPADVCRVLVGEDAAPGAAYACAPNLNTPDYSTCLQYSGDTSFCNIFGASYYAESSHNGNWRNFFYGENWCQETGIEWVECGPAISAPPESSCPAPAPAATCSNGATNPPVCTTNTSGVCLNGAIDPPACTSVPTCSNGATNPPACTTCTAPETLVGGVCATPSAAVSASLSAFPNPIPYGERSTLTWSSKNATSCTAGGEWSNQTSPVGNSLNGSGLTDPLVADTTFTFQCTGSSGTSPLQSVTVRVTGRVCENGAINPLECSQCPAGLAYIGGTCTACANGGCSSVPGGTGTGGPGGLGGSLTDPTGGLSCNNGASNPIACDNFSPTASLSANPTVIDVGQSANLVWKSTHSDSCVGTGFTTGNATSGGLSTGALREPGFHSYKLVCSKGGVFSPPAFAKVEVLTPEASMSANPLRVGFGGDTTLSWNASGVLSCAVTGPAGAVLASGPADILSHTFSTGSPQTIPVTGQSTYTITCQTNGDPIIRSVTVNVQAAFSEF